MLASVSLIASAIAIMVWTNASDGNHAISHDLAITLVGISGSLFGAGVLLLIRRPFLGAIVGFFAAIALLFLLLEYVVFANK